jgi:hypothetical protein
MMILKTYKNNNSIIINYLTNQRILILPKAIQIFNFIIKLFHQKCFYNQLYIKNMHIKIKDFLVIEIDKENIKINMTLKKFKI